MSKINEGLEQALQGVHEIVQGTLKFLNGVSEAFSGEKSDKKEQIINTRYDDNSELYSESYQGNNLKATKRTNIVHNLQLLLLVFPVAQQSIVDSIRLKKRIDYDDCEKLYKATQYLCQDTELNLLHKLSNINQFQIIKESEYDIYLITIKLNQADEGFNKNVNQLDRYDAFRKLPNLAVYVKVSPRLQMEAYGIFDVYNR